MKKLILAPMLLMAVYSCTKESVKKNTPKEESFDSAILSMSDNFLTDAPLSYTYLEDFYLNNGWVEVVPDINFEPTFTDCVVHIWQKDDKTTICYKYLTPEDIITVTDGGENSCTMKYSTYWDEETEILSSECGGEGNECRLKVSEPYDGSTEVFCCL